MIFFVTSSIIRHTTTMARTPRTDQYRKLLFRLWEALCLAYFLRPVNGPHLVTHYDPTSHTATRRRFERNLAFVCDNKRGGDSATSVAIEENDQCFRFWVSANRGVNPETLNFLRSVLNTAVAPQTDAEVQLARCCVVFSRSRINNYTRRLKNAAEKCRTYLDAEGGIASQGTRESFSTCLSIIHG